MNQKEFYYYVEEHLADLLKDDNQDLSVRLHPVRKTNDIMRYGISIFQNGTNVSPTIYLEEAWEAYQKGKKLDDILQDLVQFYQENRVFSNIRPQMEYEQIEDKIIFSILNKERKTVSLQKGNLSLTVVPKPFTEIIKRVEKYQLYVCWFT